MMKTTTWPTSPDRGCAKRHKKINEALDNPHRKSPPRAGEERSGGHRAAEYAKGLGNVICRSSFAIRLLFRRGIGECGERQAVFFDAQYCRILRKIAAVAACVAELRYEADIGQRRCIPETKRAALWLRDDQLL